MAELGRPLKYTKEAFDKKVEEYFDMCDNTTIGIGDKIITKPYTITGLCLYLDTTRETLREYELREDFVDTIKKAKNKIENYVEEHSMTGELNPTVCIFNLKNNFGWKDKTEVDSNVNANVNINEVDKKLLDNLTERLK